MKRPGNRCIIETMEKKSKGKKKRGKSILIYLFIASVLVLAGIIYLLPTVADALTKTWVIEYGSIQVTDQVTCCFVRDETLVKAEGAGSIQYYFDEGTKVRKGTKILDITPGGGGYTALENSTVSYFSDGLEASFLSLIHICLWGRRLRGAAVSA